MIKNYTPIIKLFKKNQEQPTQPVSLPKEVEPVPLKEIGVKEMIDHEPEKEVSPYIQKMAETIKLPPDLKKLGLQTPSTGQLASYQTVKLPVSDDKIIQGLHQPITSSFRWLATLALYVLRQAHLGLKIIHGHVVRVIRR